MNPGKAAMVEAVRLMERIEKLEADLLSVTGECRRMATALEKIEAEAHRGITLERNARSALQSIVMLARGKP